MTRFIKVHPVGSAKEIWLNPHQVVGVEDAGTQGPSSTTHVLLPGNVNLVVSDSVSNLREDLERALSEK